MIICNLGTDVPVTPTPALKEIRVLNSKDNKEIVQVTFYPAKGSAAKAAHYALSFVDARGKINRKADQQIPMVDQKGGDTFLVTIEQSDSVNYDMSSVTAIGPLQYDGDEFSFRITRTIPAMNDRHFLNTARAVKIWFVYAELQAEEEWIAWHKVKPLETSLEAGVTPESTASLSERTFRSPRNLPKKTPEKVSAK